MELRAQSPAAAAVRTRMRPNIRPSPSVGSEKMPVSLLSPPSAHTDRAAQHMPAPSTCPVGILSNPSDDGKPTLLLLSCPWHPPPQIGMRVGVRTRGCSGNAFTLDFADKKEKLDEEVNAYGWMHCCGGGCWLAAGYLTLFPHPPHSPAGVKVLVDGNAIMKVLVSVGGPGAAPLQPTRRLTTAPPFSPRPSATELHDGLRGRGPALGVCL